MRATDLSRLVQHLVLAVVLSHAAAHAQENGTMCPQVVESNKALIRQFYEEVWNKGNVEFARRVFADDYVRHDLRPTQAQPGPTGQVKIAADFRRAFPDLQFTAT